jgi:hypothetical protein
MWAAQIEGRASIETRLLHDYPKWRDSKALARRSSRCVPAPYHCRTVCMV